MRKNLDYILRQVRLEEGVSALEEMLLEIYLDNKISTKELSRKCLIPIPVISAIKKEFTKAHLLRYDERNRLTGPTKQWLKNIVGLSDIDLHLYKSLCPEPSFIKTFLNDEVCSLESIFKDRPNVDVTLDQSHCTVETSIKRAIIGITNNAVIGKKIVFLGDDDLISLSVSVVLKRLYGKSPIPSELHVLDIDNRYLNFIKEIANAEGFPIYCHKIDLSLILPECLKGRFDSFFTDPPYTRQGLTLFISRAVSALKHKCGLTGFLAFGHKAPSFTLNIQKTLNDMGLIVTRIIPRFNTYIGAEILGNTSQMIILKTTRKSYPAIDDVYEGPLYTGQISKTVRIYKCINCHSSIKVGSGERWRTIEILKKEGCPFCRKTIFQLQKKHISARYS